ncbi:MAG: transcriptional regulator [Anaerolineae bacterium]|nr:transcriptional regulator [Anaerolineae bacterium]
MNSQTLIKLRTKKLAVLILDARQASHYEQAQCAEQMGVSLEQYQAFEAGMQAPSLPQLESFAFFMDVPLQHFWGSDSLSKKNEDNPGAKKLEMIRQLRNRVISARIGLERTQANLSSADLAEKTGIPAAMLEKYEKESLSIPLPELEAISQVLEIPLDSLFDQKGPAGKKRVEQEYLNTFRELPEELQAFISQPVNRPFIELAFRLQNMPVDKLRSIAESLLEITY